MVLHYTHGNFPEAVQAYQHLTAFPNSTYPIRLQDYKVELDALSLLLIKDPDDLFAKLKERVAALDPDSVIMLGEEFLAQYPADERVILVQGMIAKAYFDQGQYARSLAIDRSMQDRHPADALSEDAWYRTGLSYFKLNDWLLAKAVLQASVQSFPNSAYAVDARSALVEIETRLSGAAQLDCDALKSKGNDLYKESQYSAAMEYYQTALACYQARGSQNGSARSRMNIGNVHRDLGNYAEADSYYLQVLDAASGLNDPEVDVMVRVNLGSEYNQQGDYKKGSIYLEEALNRIDPVKNQADLPFLYITLGEAYSGLEAYDQALNTYQKALGLFPTPSTERALILALIGETYLKIDTDYQGKAVETLEQALDLWQQTGDKKKVAGLSLELAGIYLLQDNNPKALALGEQAYQLFTELGRPAEACLALSGRGALLSEMEDYQGALKAYQEGIVLSQANDLKDQQATFQKLIGLLYLKDFNSPDQALPFYQDALTLSASLHNREQSAEIFGLMGVAYNSLGKKVQALLHYQQALLLWQYSGRTPELATAWVNVARTQKQLGMVEVAKESFRQAMAIFDELEDSYLEVDALLQLAALEAQFGSKVQAQTILQRVLPLKDDLMVTQLSGSLFEVPITRSVLLSRAAIVYWLLGDYEQYIVYLREELSSYPEDGSDAEKADILENVGNAYEALEDPAQALHAYLQAIELWENLRSSTQAEDIQSILANRSAVAYQRAILLQVQAGHFPEAFSLAERSRSWSLLDQLNLPNVSNGSEFTDVEKSLRGALRELELNINTLENQLEDKSLELDQINADMEINQFDMNLVEKFQSLSTEKRNLEAYLQESQALLETAYLRYEALLLQNRLANNSSQSTTPVDVITLDTLRQNLPADVTLLEYYVAPGAILAFVIDRQGLHVEQIAASEDDIVNPLKSLRDSFSPRDPSVPPQLVALYDLLYRPVEPYINTTNVYIIPHGVLHYLPFGALHDGTDYLINRHVMAYLPSASAWTLLRQAGASSNTVNTSMLSLCKSTAEGEVTLVEACPQARQIAGMFDAETFEEGAASETFFQQQAASAGWIHIAAHGKFDMKMPMLSRMYLAGDAQNDGLLEVPEIYNLKLSDDVQLVTLSGCQTAMPESNRQNPDPDQAQAEEKVISPGDEIVSLNRAFISAGAPSVLATLWSVDDSSTSELMINFYGYIERGYTKAAALRCAQVDMLRKAGPYHWAGFVLTGDMGAGIDDITCNESVTDSVAAPTAAPLPSSTAIATAAPIPTDIIGGDAAGPRLVTLGLGAGALVLCGVGLLLVIVVAVLAWNRARR